MLRAYVKTRRAARLSAGAVAALTLSALAVGAFAPAAAAAGPVVTATVQSGSPTTIISGLNAGDVVSIEATLSTSDPNENGEGEPLVLQSSGGFSIVVPEYELARAVTYTATANGETLSGYIGGFDADETATVKVSVNPTSGGGFFSKDTKEALHKAAVVNGTITAGAAATGVAFPPAAVFTEPFAARVGLGAAIQELLSLDPSDPNFTAIAKPTFPALPPVQAGPGTTQAEVDAFNALMDNLEHQIGLGNAAYTSFNRATGALDAGNSAWATRQQQAGLDYLGQMGQVVGAEPGLLNRFVAALHAGGFQATTLGPDDVFSFESQVIQTGLPGTIPAKMRALGADDATVAHLGRIAAVQDINVVAGTYLDKIADPSVTDALTALSQSLIAEANCKPGNGYGDKNHCHSGPPGRS